jgi:hypothetical protein
MLVSICLVACGTSDDRVRVLVAPTASTTPGTLVAALLLPGDPSADRAHALIARSDGGIAVTANNDLWILDGQARTVGRDTTADVLALAAAPDDTLFATSAPTVGDAATVRAWSATGQPLWAAPLDAVAVAIAARPEGPYVEASGGTIYAFDAATGARRAFATHQRLLAATHAGVVTFDAPTATTAVVHLLDRAGSTVWSHTASWPAGTRGLSIELAAAMPDGGVAIFGGASTDTDLSDATIPAGGYVAVFSATGATRWVAHYAGLPKPVLSRPVRGFAAVGHGQVAVVDDTDGPYPSPPADTSITVLDAGAVARTAKVDGVEAQVTRGIAAAPDGALWLEVDNEVTDDNRPSPVLTVLGHTFTDPGTYLLELAP